MKKMSSIKKNSKKKSNWFLEKNVHWYSYIIHRNLPLLVAKKTLINLLADLLFVILILIYIYKSFSGFLQNVQIQLRMESGILREWGKAFELVGVFAPACVLFRRPGALFSKWRYYSGRSSWNPFLRWHLQTSTGAGYEMLSSQSDEMGRCSIMTRSSNHHVHRHTSLYLESGKIWPLVHKIAFSSELWKGFCS